MLADGGVQLKADYGSCTDEEDDEDVSSAGGDADGGHALDPESRAYKRLPSPVRQKLQRMQDLEGEVERLHDENARLREVGAASIAIACALC